MPDREAGYINVMLWLSFYTHKNQKIQRDVSHPNGNSAPANNCRY